MRKLLPSAVHLATLATFVAAWLGTLPLWSVAVAIAAWYVLSGPAAVYASTERPLSNAVYEVLPRDAETTRGSDDWARSLTGQLARHGFIPRAKYRLRGQTPFDFAQRLDNDLTGEVAVIIAGWNKTPEGPAVPVRLTVFHTCFRDGGELVTTNSPLPSTTPDLPGQVSYRMPEVRDANTLYTIHRRLVRADQRKPKPILLGDDPLAWEREQNQRAIAVQVAHGLGVRDEKAGVMRLTLKGALRATWLLHPALTRLQDRRSSAAAAAALRTVTA